MARKALINGEGIVVNIIEVGGGTHYSPPVGHTLLDAIGASIGSRWTGNGFSHPTPPPLPQPSRTEEDIARLEVAVQLLLDKSVEHGWITASQRGNVGLPPSSRSDITSGSGR